MTKIFELPGLWFSASELYALLTAQQLLAHVQPGLLDTQLKPVKGRIEKILSASQLGDVKLLSGHPSEEISKRVRILRMSGRNVILDCFQTVAGALLQRSRLNIYSHYASSYGIFAGKAKHLAVLRFTPERARWVADEHWHPQQQSRMLADGSYELRVPYSDSRELVMDILKHSGEVEVISPEALRDAVTERLKSALGHYR